MCATRFHKSVRDLPEDLTSPPVVSKADANASPIITMTVQSSTRNPLQLTEYATNVLVERLQTIPGVSGIQIWGEKRFAMRIWLDPAKLSAYNLDTAGCAAGPEQGKCRVTIRKRSPGNPTELTVRTFGRLLTEDDFNNVVVKSAATGDIRLLDVGHALLGPENEESVLRESNIPMVGLAMVPLPGANYVSIADEFYKRLEQIKKDVPEDISLNVAHGSDRVHQTFDHRSGGDAPHFIPAGGAHHLPVLPRCDHRASSADRYSRFVARHLLHHVPRPVSPINVLTMLGIVLATGLVVDDGIVVTENIYKKLESGMNKYQAAQGRIERDLLCGHLDIHYPGCCVPADPLPVRASPEGSSPSSAW